MYYLYTYITPKGTPVTWKRSLIGFKNKNYADFGHRIFEAIVKGDMQIAHPVPLDNKVILQLGPLHNHILPEPISSIHSTDVTAVFHYCCFEGYDLFLVEDIRIDEFNRVRFEGNIISTMDACPLV